MATSIAFVQVLFIILNTVWHNWVQLLVEKLQTVGNTALDNYDAALKLGYTKSIEGLQTAGIEFNFSQEYVKELADFIKAELAKIS